MDKFDFGGWATKHNIKCSDGRTITKDAFKHYDGKVVPLVWSHRHDEPRNILGHAVLESLDEGMYAYGVFNDTENGQNAKALVEHGDISALSIYANQLKQQGSNVIHGSIREVSLVLAGANPGAIIDAVMAHKDDADAIESAIIFTGEELELFHSDDDQKEGDESMQHADKDDGDESMQHADKDDGDESVQHADKDDGEETIEDVFNTLTEKQKKVVYALIGQALGKNTDEEDDDEVEHSDNNNENNNNNLEGGSNTMKKNVFEQQGTEDKKEVLSHDAMNEILTDFKRIGSLRETFLQHGITDVEYLFPELQNVSDKPSLITRDMTWVTKIMNGVHKTPFSRIKSLYADITEADARAKGYIKGGLKVEEVFTMLKRTTQPTTVYKKQKLDRDDVVDMVDFDSIAFLKSEMRLMIDEELARAFLVGDCRLTSSDDKINEQAIRPIWTDTSLFTIKKQVAVPQDGTADQLAKAFMRACVKSRKEYKGSGNPTLFTTEDLLTDCLLMEDTTGRIIYDSVEKLAAALRVKEIITVPVMEGLSRVDPVAGPLFLLGIVVNMADYNVGADKGGAINMFEDFDIDYNAQKYLIETRCSGALIKPYSAIALETSFVRPPELV